MLRKYLMMSVTALILIIIAAYSSLEVSTTGGGDGHNAINFEIKVAE